MHVICCEKIFLRLEIDVGTAPICECVSKIFLVGFETPEKLPFGRNPAAPLTQRRNGHNLDDHHHHSLIVELDELQFSYFDIHDGSEITAQVLMHHHTFWKSLLWPDSHPIVLYKKTAKFQSMFFFKKIAKIWFPLNAPLQPWQSTTLAILLPQALTELEFIQLGNEIVMMTIIQIMAINQR